MVSWNAHVRILLLYNSGLTDKQIAERTGYTVEEIIEWRCEYGYRRNRTKKKSVVKKQKPKAKESAHEPFRQSPPGMSLRRKGERRGRYCY